MFTPRDVITLVMWLSGAIVSVSGAVAVIATWVHKARKPSEDQKARLDEHERRLNEHDEFLKKDKSRIDRIEEGNRVTQKALLALLAHAINGNNVDELKSAESALRDFLINN